MSTFDESQTLRSARDHKELKKLIKIKSETNQRGVRDWVLPGLDEDWPVGVLSSIIGMTERAVYNLRVRYQEE